MDIDVRGSEQDPKKTSKWKRTVDFGASQSIRFRSKSLPPLPTFWKSLRSKQPAWPITIVPLVAPKPRAQVGDHRAYSVSSTDQGSHRGSPDPQVKVEQRPSPSLPTPRLGVDKRWIVSPPQTKPSLHKPGRRCLELLLLALGSIFSCQRIIC